jgi:hypothetical protein
MKMVQVIVTLPSRDEWSLKSNWLISTSMPPKKTGFRLGPDWLAMLQGLGIF